MHTIEAILIQAISFVDFNQVIVLLPPGSIVLVDINQNIGYANGKHFTIFPNEYRPKFVN